MSRAEITRTFGSKLDGFYKRLDNTVCQGCPLNFGTDEHDYIQNMGCLPDWQYLLKEYLENNGHWKCHSNNNKCRGFSKLLDHLEIDRNGRNNDLLITGDNPMIEERFLNGKKI